MLKIKSTFRHFLILLALIAVNPPVSSSWAQGSCSTALETAAQAEAADQPRLAIHDFQNKISIPQDLVGKVKRLMSSYGVTTSSKKYAFAVSKVFDKLLKDEGTPLEHAEKMASFANELEPLMQTLDEERRREIQYLEATAVLRLEAFRPSEFKPLAEGEEFAVTKWKNDSVIRFPQYLHWMTEYVNNTPFFQAAKTGGLLNGVDIRDFETHNQWMLFLKPHDYRHSHYGLARPMTNSIIFDASRSKDHYRYVLIAALWEGVDTVQFTQETAICRYMRATMNMNLEQAMIYLGRATKQQLDEVARGSGQLTQFQAMANNMANYVPRGTSEFPGEGLEQEVDAMVDLFRSYRTNAEANNDQTTLQILNYQQNPVVGGSATKDKSIHHN